MEAKLIELIRKYGIGRLSIILGTDNLWTVALEYGSEDGESLMTGGASYGFGADLDDALRQVCDEVGIHG